MDKLKVGLTFSGGGYRAACFHLGTLSYLDSVKMEGGDTLLDCVTALSTIPGGTITGLCYMLGISRGESVHSISKKLSSLLELMSNENVELIVLRRKLVLARLLLLWGLMH